MTTATADVLGPHPRVAQALNTARALAASHNDAELLAIAERRISELLGAERQGMPVNVDAPTTAVGTAALAFIEQWVIDVANITDDMVAALRTELGEDRLMDFIHGVLAVEQRIRLELAWHKLGLTT